MSRPTSPLLIPSESLGRSNSLSVGRSDSRASISKAFESKILGLGRSNSLSGTYSKPRMSISRAFGSSFLSRSNSRASSVNTVISDENSLCSAPGRSPRPISPAAYRFDDILPYSPSQTILNPTSQKTFDEIITNYSPTRVPRRSLDESKRTPFKILTTLNPIDEEPLKRTLSLPTTRSCHSTIFTTTLYKKSTKGLYQKRIVRFDGSTFVCMSSTLTTNPDSSLDRILLAREIQPTCKLFFKPKFQVRVEEMTITEGGREWFKVSNGREKIKFRVGDGVMKQVLRRVLVERWSDILTNLQGDIVTVIEDVKGIKVISGVVERVPRFVRRVERIRNSRDIERSIVEIDEEMSALGL